MVRLGTYESKEHQDMVRELLRGTFQNTAFVIYAPDGETKLTRAGRGPHHAFGNGTEDSVNGMKEIAAKYQKKGDDSMSVLQDFHSFKQSLNVSSADQRLLLFTISEGQTEKSAESALKSIFNDQELTGRFHFDQAGDKDKDWAQSIKKVKSKAGHFIIRPGKFGIEGEVMYELPLDASSKDLKDALLKANTEYSKTEERKVYASHVMEGRKEGIHFENTMPPGEDRDGDGKIDAKKRGQ